MSERDPHDRDRDDAGRTRTLAGGVVDGSPQDGELSGRGLPQEQKPVVDDTEYREVVDPDVDLHDPAQRREVRPRQWDLILATAAGGVLGAWSRYWLGLAVPHSDSAFPWSTVIINATGCLLIGALMVVLLELTSPHRLVRPFLGVGVLGGYTTFSTFAVDAERLIIDHRPLLALLYVVVTLAACGAAVWLATAATLNIGRALITSRVRRRRRDRSLT